MSYLTPLQRSHLMIFWLRDLLVRRSLKSSTLVMHSSVPKYIYYDSKVFCFAGRLMVGLYRTSCLVRKSGKFSKSRLSGNCTFFLPGRRTFNTFKNRRKKISCSKISFFRLFLLLHIFKYIPI